MSVDTIMHEVLAERVRQQAALGYTDELDDARGRYFWAALVSRQAGLSVPDGSTPMDKARFRKQMIRAAAVALAAVESEDRKAKAERDGRLPSATPPDPLVVTGRAAGPDTDAPGSGRCPPPERKSSMKTVLELMQQLAHLDPKLPVAIAIDPEGNGFRPAGEAASGVVELNEWKGSPPRGVKDNQDIVIIWPRH